MKVCLECGSTFGSSIWRCPRCDFAPQQLHGIKLLAPNFARESDGFEENFFEELASLESKNFWFQARNQLILWALNKYFKSPKNLLEVGCGTGFVLQGIRQKFPKTIITGTEVLVKGLEFASRRVPQANLLQMDARKIPFLEEFSVICACDVLEHIFEDHQALNQLYQATENGGGILLTVPQHTWLWSIADDYAHHYRRYSARELCSKVEKAGFKVLKITSFVSLLLPIMLLSRYRQKATNGDYSPTAELRLPSPINFIFEVIMRIEYFFITNGISFPCGGSLLLVAIKPKG